jgi:hypothetical protein
MVESLTLTTKYLPRENIPLGSYVGDINSGLSKYTFHDSKDLS